MSRVRGVQLLDLDHQIAVTTDELQQRPIRVSLHEVHDISSCGHVHPPDLGNEVIDNQTG